MLDSIECIAFVLAGLGGIVFSFVIVSYPLSFLNHIPALHKNRKILFSVGFIIAIAGIASSYWIATLHGFISLSGCWIALLGSASWFNRRIARRTFIPGECKVIRTTILAGFIIIALSVIIFSVGTFLMGIAILLPAARLWWKMDVIFQDSLMAVNKRN